jgi:tetratricopeptide (TPR) repeat protein
MKLFKKIKFLPRVMKGTWALIKSRDLQIDGKYEKALILIDKYKDLFEGKNFQYHLNRGRILVNARNDYKAAIQEYSKGISLLNLDKKMNSNWREYYLAWVKHSIGGCYYELGEKDNTETWIAESEKHDFNYEKIPENIRSAFPMRWHDDYKL